MQEVTTYPDKASFKDWLPVCSLGFAAFIFVTSELMPIGLLPEMAADFGKSESFTGLIITIYAWIVALLSIPLTILTEKVDRRKLLMVLFTAFIVSQGLAAFTKSFYGLLGVRTCIAMAHAVFWSITTPLAARLAPQGKKPQALTIVITGTSLATVLGVPIGSILGYHLGWRFAFVSIGILALLVMLSLARTLPSLPSVNTNTLGSLPTLVKKKTLLLLYGMTILVVTGHFCTFSYLAPFFQSYAGLGNEVSSFLLLAIGGAGILGSVIASRYAESQPKQGIIAALFIIFFCLLLFKFAAVSFYFLLVACVLWGMGMAMVSLLFQTTILRGAGKAADLASSIYSALFNVGIGSGALVGGQVFNFFGLSDIGFAGAAFLVIAIFVTFFLHPEQQ